MSDISIFKKALQATKMTFAQAEEKVKAEASRQSVNRFRINSDGEYNIRICPLIPVIDADGNPQEMDRIGYEYPLHQQFLKIVTPPKKKGAKPGSITIPVIRATDAGVGFSVDLIDEYVKIAKEYGDEAVTKKVTSNSFEGGLRWGYQHAMYVIDMEKRKDGIQIFQMSHAQYRTLETAKMSVWKDLREENPDCACPISDYESAYQVRINRTTESKKTEYTITVNTVKKRDALTDDELDKLITMNRIPAEIYRYTRYQMEATLEFLKQYDEKLQIDVCEQDDFKAIVETLKGELPADDTSHFSISDAKSGDDNGNKGEEITIDSLWAEADALADAGLGRGSDEYAELREKIREFTAEHDIDIRLSASKTNEELLEAIEDAMKEAKKQSSKKQEEKSAEEEADDNAEAESEEEKPADEPEEKPAPRRRRAPRPTDEEEEDNNESEKASEAAAEEEEQEEEPAPAPRRRRR